MLLRVRSGHKRMRAIHGRNKGGKGEDQTTRGAGRRYPRREWRRARIGTRAGRLDHQVHHDRQARSYELTRNLAAAGDCLLIAADFVTIDLGGWVITGDGSTGSGITDLGAPRRGIAVRNGTITGFLACVGLSRTTGAVVDKVRADCEETGISAGSDSIVSGNTARALVFGISAGSDSIISGNVATSSDSAIRAGSGSIVSRNVVAQSDFGISAGSLSTVSGNNVGAIDVGISAGPGSLVGGNNAHPQSEGDEPEGPAFAVTCPSNVIGNTATGDLLLNGAGCTNIDNLAP
jgi:hypothetical protein